ncbi:MAG: hypothetical protein WDN00_17060 [Limisphaerales bacterium]
MTTFAESPLPIDRHALVARHNIEWPSINGEIPLGNGNFAFNVDGTGLETVRGNIMSHWCWHSFPLPSGVTKDQIRPWGTPDHGRMTLPLTTRDPEPIADWEYNNPQPLNLGRIGFINQKGERLAASEVHMDSRHLELWTGILTSRFTYLGETVMVQTCVDPKTDTVAVHVQSVLLRDGRLMVMLDFPAPTLNVGGWLGDFSRITGHQTAIIRQAQNSLQLHRTIDDAQYDVVLSGHGFNVTRPMTINPEIESARYGANDGGWTNVTAQVASALHDHGTVTANNDAFGDPAFHHAKKLVIQYRLDGKERTNVLSENDSWNIRSSPHQFIVAPNAGTSEIDFTCTFGANITGAGTLTFADVKATCETSWPKFWNSGGAIDLSKSRDPRWQELERRIVLSQYELAAQSAGDNPPAEAGLTGMDVWHGKWHFEMIWWHLAHYRALGSLADGRKSPVYLFPRFPGGPGHCHQFQLSRLDVAQIHRPQWLQRWLSHRNVAAVAGTTPDFLRGTGLSAASHARHFGQVAEHCIRHRRFHGGLSQTRSNQRSIQPRPCLPRQRRQVQSVANEHRF